MMMDSLGTRPGVIRKQLLFDSALGSLVLAERIAGVYSTLFSPSKNCHDRQREARTREIRDPGWVLLGRSTRESPGLLLPCPLTAGSKRNQGKPSARLHSESFWLPRRDGTGPLAWNSRSPSASRCIFKGCTFNKMKRQSFLLSGFLSPATTHVRPC